MTADDEVDTGVEPETDPPPADPSVREALDRMEDERQIPEAEEAADADGDDELPVDEGEADEGEEAPTG
ncbi:MAG TPA: hypothetical protein VD926_09420 [Acidimicrobiales bacterium]|nr:hypothetical protein [Acidimicrobiales bacterium]